MSGQSGHPDQSQTRPESDQTRLRLTNVLFWNWEMYFLQLWNVVVPHCKIFCIKLWNYLSQIVKCICLELQNVFVFYWQMYLFKCICSNVFVQMYLFQIAKYFVSNCETPCLKLWSASVENWSRINEKWLKYLIDTPNFIDQLHKYKKIN